MHEYLRIRNYLLSQGKKIGNTFSSSNRVFHSLQIRKERHVSYYIIYKYLNTRRRSDVKTNEQVLSYVPIRDVYVVRSYKMRFSISRSHRMMRNTVRELKIIFGIGDDVTHS